MSDFTESGEIGPDGELYDASAEYDDDGGGYAEGYDAQGDYADDGLEDDGAFEAGVQQLVDQRVEETLAPYREAAFEDEVGRLVADHPALGSRATRSA